ALRWSDRARWKSLHSSFRSRPSHSGTTRYLRRYPELGCALRPVRIAVRWTADHPAHDFAGGVLDIEQVHADLPLRDFRRNAVEMVAMGLGEAEDIGEVAVEHRAQRTEHSLLVQPGPQASRRGQ